MTATETGWLIDETRPLTATQVDQLDRELADGDATTRDATTRGGGPDRLTLAISLHDVVVHDNRKWFGEADIRLDALVVTGYGTEDEPDSHYRAKTVPFGRIKDSDRLQIGQEGLLVFHGPVTHFVDLFLMVSRDRQDSDDLASLLTDGLKAEETQAAIGGLLGLTAAAPHVAAVVAAIGAAAVLGDVAYRLLRQTTGGTIGLYRTSHLAHRDDFGIGRHPAPPHQTYRMNDLSFRYEISDESRP